ncbi:hypothetical protein NX059_009359 [Plenodomus lindquistii]|nr:hypothetical protein NX059_009359 [Plenodomus lindquistii]
MHQQYLEDVDKLGKGQGVGSRKVYTKISAKQHHRQTQAKSDRGMAALAGQSASKRRRSEPKTLNFDTVEYRASGQEGDEEEVLSFGATDTEHGGRRLH